MLYYRRDNMDCPQTFLEIYTTKKKVSQRNLCYLPHWVISISSSDDTMLMYDDDVTIETVFVRFDKYQKWTVHIVVTMMIIGPINVW